jgi:hypothetical protein
MIELEANTFNYKQSAQFNSRIMRTTIVQWTSRERAMFDIKGAMSVSDVLYHISNVAQMSRMELFIIEMQPTRLNM